MATNPGFLPSLPPQASAAIRKAFVAFSRKLKSHDDTLTDHETRVADLESRVTTLEGFHP